MSSFIEFQAIVFDKLSAIENRLINIENVLGISSEQCELHDIPIINSDSSEIENEKNDTLKKELIDFQDELSDIKNLFITSDN